MPDPPPTPRPPGLLARLGQLVIIDGPWASDQEAAFWEEQRNSVARYGRTLLLVLVVLDFLWWPADLPAFQGDGSLLRAFVISRAWAVFSTLLVCLLMPQVEGMRRHPTLSVVLQVGTVAFVTGGVFGGLVGRAAPWFNYTPYILLSPATLPFPRPWVRAAATVGLAIALCSGFFFLHPANLGDLRLTKALFFVGGVLVFTMLAGVFTDGMRRGIFALQWATQRQAIELRDLNEHLETRVREQTAEVRRLASHIENAREDERAHIARELHDELGQDQAALRYALKFARIRYGQDATAIASHLEELELLLERTTTTTRSILSSLRPTVVDDLGLSAAAEWMAKRARERTGLDVHLTMPNDDLKLPKPVAAAAFRILQESLTNIARHAQAKRVLIDLRAAGSGLELTVEDDGVGFTPRAPGGPAAGIGLIGIRERVLALGGTLRIDSEPNKGTHIHVRLPVYGRTEGVAA